MITMITITHELIMFFMRLHSPISPNIVICTLTNYCPSICHHQLNHHQHHHQHQYHHHHQHQYNHHHHHHHHHPHPHPHHHHQTETIIKLRKYMNVHEVRQVGFTFKLCNFVRNMCVCVSIYLFKACNSVTSNNTHKTKKTMFQQDNNQVTPIHA